MLKEQNPAMLCDFYEMTMSRGYFEHGFKDKIAYFDLFFRNVPDGGGFAIAAGLEQLIEYVRDLHFDDEDVDFLRRKGGFSEAFLAYLKEFRFTGDVWAVPEGTFSSSSYRSFAVPARTVKLSMLLPKLSSAPITSSNASSRIHFIFCFITCSILRTDRKTILRTGLQQAEQRAAHGGQDHQNGQSQTDGAYNFLFHNTSIPLF